MQQSDVQPIPVLHGFRDVGGNQSRTLGRIIWKGVRQCCKTDEVFRYWIPLLHCGGIQNRQGRRTRIKVNSIAFQIHRRIPVTVVYLDGMRYGLQGFLYKVFLERYRLPLAFAPRIRQKP